MMDEHEETSGSTEYTNIAQDSTSVGVQGVVHGNVYFGTNTPAQKYALGKNRLHRGLPREAEALLGEAVQEEDQSPEIGYYWALSILSGRSFDQLDEGELRNLMRACQLMENQREDTWSDALAVINQLIVHLWEQDQPMAPGTITLATVRKEFEALDPHRQEEIQRHLDRMLSGAVREDFYSKEKDEAEHRRKRGERKRRATKFFEPNPAEPRPIAPPQEPSRILPILKLVLGASVGVAGLSVALPALLQGLRSAALGLTLIIVGTLAVAWYGLQRRIILDRRKRYQERWEIPEEEDGQRWKPETYWGHIALNVVRGAFNRSAPDDEEERKLWREVTKGFRLNLTRELVETYEPTVKRAVDIRWLARWHAEQIARSWAEDRLDEFRLLNTVPRRIYLGIMIFSIVLVLGTMLSWRTLWQSGGFTEYAIAPVLIALGVRVGCDQACELRRRSRYHADTLIEIQQHLSDELLAYREVRTYLDDRPSDMEMARWLDHDKRYLRAIAMELCEVNNRDVVTHLALTEPGPQCDRARVSQGPARYSKYVIKIFLLTTHGVRLYEFYLDTLTGDWEEKGRHSFRYDAIASVQVTRIRVTKRGPVLGVPAKQQSGGETPSSVGADRKPSRPVTTYHDIFKIVLVSSESIRVFAEMVDEFDDEGQDESEWDELLARALDSSGVSGALRMMEAITADGTEWLTSRQSRQRRRLAYAEQ